MRNVELWLGMDFRRCSLVPALALGIWLSGVVLLFGQAVQSTRLENGLWQLESDYLQLLTDIPLDDEIAALPRVFDQAVEQWCARFAVDREKTHGVKAIACLMNDRSRFIQLELMPAGTVNFRHGYQQEDHLFMMEQPSGYYRRHLMLHEGTHWFLWKFLGGNGPPWFSEGLCELLGTHEWDGQSLKLGVIPNHRDRFPYWGRLKLIHDSLDQNSAPTLSTILRFSDTAHRTDEPYAWSWAAMLFFTSHPKYHVILEQIAQPPLDYSNRITIELKRALSDSWAVVDAEWRVFISELDFGFSPSQSLVDMASVPRQSLQGHNKLSIRSDRGWQSTGLMVEVGQRIRFAADGKFVVRKRDSENQVDWQSEAQGVTLQYYQGQPVGRLLATIVPIDDAAVDKPIRRCTSYPIGRKATWAVPESGLLLLKINEDSAGLIDNSGGLTVMLEPDVS